MLLGDEATSRPFDARAAYGATIGELTVNALRRRHLSARDATVDSICFLTPEQVAQRRVPINRLLDVGAFEPAPYGYSIHLPRSDASWSLANQFVDEESVCCPSMTFDVVEEQGAVAVRAVFEGLAAS